MARWIRMEMMVFPSPHSNRRAKNTKWKFYCVHILFKWLNDFGHTTLTCNHFTTSTVITVGRTHRLDKCLFHDKDYIYKHILAWYSMPQAKQLKHAVIFPIFFSLSLHVHHILYSVCAHHKYYDEITSHTVYFRKKRAFSLHTARPQAPSQMVFVAKICMKLNVSFWTKYIHKMSEKKMCLSFFPFFLFWILWNGEKNCTPQNYCSSFISILYTYKYIQTFSK